MKIIPTLIFMLTAYFCHTTTGQVYCFQDEIYIQKIEEVSISVDGQIWTSSASCFQFPVGIDSLFIKAPGYLTKLIKKENLQEKEGVIFLQPDYHTLQEVVITANRMQEKRRDIAQELHSQKATELYRIQSATMADALQQTGEVFVQKSQAAGGSPVLRGFEANRIGLVVDGVRMNNLMFRAGHLQNILSVDPFILENADVLMGPSSVMYGSDAMGGVIHMRSRKPSLLPSDSSTHFHGQAFLRGCSATRGSQYHTDFEIRQKKWASLSSFTFYQTSDFAAGKNRPESYGKWGLDTFYVNRRNGKDSVYVNDKPWIQKFSGYQQADFMEKLLFKTGENSKLIACVQYSVSDDLPRYDRLEQVKNGTARYAEWYYGPQKRLLSYLKWESAKSTQLFDRFNVQLAGQYFRESRHSRSLNNDFLQNRIERAKVVSVNLDLSKRIGKHELRYGIETTIQGLKSEAHTTDINSGEQEKLDTRYPNGGSSMQTAGIYLFDALEISDKWIMQAAARYNFTGLHATFSDTTFFNFPFTEVAQQNRALNGSASVIWLPVEKIKNVLLFSSAFKAPNVDDLTKVFESSPGNIIVPNEHIKPERTYTLEYGLEVVNNKRYHFQTRVYYTWYNDIMTLLPSTYQGQDSIVYDGAQSRVLSMQNRNKGFIYGGFSSLWLKFGNFQLSQTGTITMGQIISDTGTVYLDHIPPFIGKTSLMFSKKIWTTEVLALYNGMKPIREFSLSGEDNADQTLKTGSPSYLIFSIKNQIAVQNNLLISFAVENITNRYYRPFASGIAGVGRNFIVGVKATF